MLEIVAGCGKLLVKQNSLVSMEKHVVLVTSQANPHCLDLMMMAREKIFILVSSEPRSWILDGDSEREGKIGVSVHHHCMTISEQG